MRQLVIKLKYIWVVAVVVFIFLYFYKNYLLIFNILSYLPLSNVILSFLSILVAKFFLTYVSMLSTHYFDKRINYKKMFQIYNIAQLGKYVPGSIWQFVGKAGAYTLEGLEKKVIQKSLVLEVVWVLGTSLIIGLFFIILSDNQILNINILLPTLDSYYFFYLALLLLFILIFLFFKYKEVTDCLNTIAKNFFINFKMFFVLISVWFFLGFSFYITLVPYLGKASFLNYLYVVGLYSLAYGIGFLVPFAPAGMGVREGILVAGVSFFIDGDNALVLASLNRVFYILIEVFIVIVCVKKNN